MTPLVIRNNDDPTGTTGEISELADSFAVSRVVQVGFA